jgi:tetratricopeptide (TPR) repeat protein
MLKPRKKITRKELKRDPLLEILYSIRHWWMANKGIVSRYGGIGLIVIILSVLVFRWRGAQNEKAAAVAGIAHVEFSNGNYNTVIATLGDVVEEYSGLKSFGNALFLLARSELYVQDTLNAEKHYRLYLDEYSKDPLLISGAYAGLGLIAEGRHSYAESAEYFRKASQSAPTNRLVYQYSIYAGRNYLLASSPDEALTILQDLPINKDIDYQISSEIQELIAAARYMKLEDDGA